MSIGESIKTRWIAVALFALTISSYWQVGSCAFIDYDDGEYVVGNPHVLDGLTWAGVVWAFTTNHAANWHPLTWLSHMADAQVFGLNPAGHHWVSLLLHATTAVALFIVLHKMTATVWRSAIVAALFAGHPLHVESVAWVAERKDVLSGLFGVLTLGAYSAYAQRPSLGRYLLTALFFALGLMSKPMLVTIPLLLFVLDWWPLGRLSIPNSASRDREAGRLIVEKLPLLALSVAASVATFLVQHSKGATATTLDFPFGARVANALVSYAVYLWKALWPTSLAVFYPHPSSLHEMIPNWQVIAAATGLGLISVAAIKQARHRPFLAAGWLWYLITLIPVVGFVQVGMQARADRYTYLPLIGIFIAVTWAIEDWARGGKARRIVASAVAVAVLAGLCLTTWIQCGTWRDGTTLYTHAIRVTDKNFVAWNNLGMQYLGRGNVNRARECFETAASLKPDYADAWYNVGVAFSRLGQWQQAIARYRESLRLQPENADGWINLGLALQESGQFVAACEAYRAGLEYRDDDATALFNLALLQAVYGDRQQALAAYARLRAVSPERADQLTALGVFGPAKNAPSRGPGVP